MREHDRTITLTPERSIERASSGIAGIALGAGLMFVLIPAFAAVFWPERRAAPPPDAPLARVVLEVPTSFEAVWADARSPLSSLHPPPALEASAEAAPVEAAPGAAAPRRRAATIPVPPQRPAPDVAAVADPAPAPAVQRRERPRVLGVDMPTLDDAQRLIDDAAALAGTVTRHIPRI